MRKTIGGDLREVVRFQTRTETDDGYGNQVSGEWTAQFTRWCDVRPLRGTEEVVASRLQGIQPVRIVVYSDTETRTITPEWRAVDTRGGQVYAIKSIVDEERLSQYLTLDAVLGEAP